MLNPSWVGVPDNSTPPCWMQQRTAAAKPNLPLQQQRGGREASGVEGGEEAEVEGEHGADVEGLRR